MRETVDFALIRRLRDVRDRAMPATEGELRELTEQAAAWARTVEGQLGTSERRLARLTSNEASSLAQIAAELRRVDTLRPHLNEVRSLIADLEDRARELRTKWLLSQASAATAAARRPSADRA